MIKFFYIIGMFLVWFCIGIFIQSLIYFFLALSGKVNYTDLDSFNPLWSILLAFGMMFYYVGVMF